MAKYVECYACGERIRPDEKAYRIDDEIYCFECGRETLWYDFGLQVSEDDCDRSDEEDAFDEHNDELYERAKEERIWQS